MVSQGDRHSKRRFSEIQYHNAPDNLVAVMEMEDGERQMLYGAVSEESYEKLLDAVAEIGEPV